MNADVAGDLGLSFDAPGGSGKFDKRCHRWRPDKPSADFLHVVTSRCDADKITVRRKASYTGRKYTSRRTWECVELPSNLSDRGSFLTWRLLNFLFQSRRSRLKWFDHYWEERNKEQRSSLKMCGQKKKKKEGGSGGSYLDAVDDRSGDSSVVRISGTAWFFFVPLFVSPHTSQRLTDPSLSALWMQLPGNVQTWLDDNRLLEILFTWPFPCECKTFPIHSVEQISLLPVIPPIGERDRKLGRPCVRDVVCDSLTAQNAITTVPVSIPSALLSSGFVDNIFLT